MTDLGTRTETAQTPARAGAALRRAAPALLGFAAVRALGLLVLTVWSAARDKSAYTLLTARWDALWYTRVAELGYGYEVRLPNGDVHSNLAFFPLLPWLEKLGAALTPLSYADTGFVVLSAHDIIDAERFAERQEEDDHRSAAERAAADRTWAFGHIIVDEAQELSPMAWRLLMRRSPTRSMTLVGDPAQTAEAAGVGSWDKILQPYVEDRWEHTRLAVNYRTPAEIMDLAAAVVRAENPAFEPPSSVRSTGVRPWVRATDDLPGAVAKAVAELTPEEGRLAVIAPRDLHRRLAAGLDGVTADAEPDLTHSVVLLDPRQAKGLEFDSVLVVEPGRYGTSDLYVALTRATQHLGVLHTGDLPKGLTQFS